MINAAWPFSHPAAARTILGMPSKNARTYVAVAFNVWPRMADDAAGILIADGALGCEVSKIRPGSQIVGRNRPIRLCAYFERMTAAMIKRLEARLQAAGMLSHGSTPEPRVLVDPGWATLWQGRFAPFRTGRRFLIVPPWQRTSEPDRIELVIRPGQAFGTGHHPSTSGTLSAVEQLCGERRVAQALDVGTGSGILAIAMIKLGITKVNAIDIDTTALANARENARLNRVSGNIQFSTTPLSKLRGHFGLIAANILSSILIPMAPDLKARLRRRGHLVLAGVLKREAQSVADAYLPELSCVAVNNHGAWTTLIFQK